MDFNFEIADENKEITFLTVDDIYKTIRFLNSKNLDSGVETIHLGPEVSDLPLPLSNFPNLKNITVTPDNPNYKSVDGVLYSKDGKSLILVPPEKEGHLEILEGTEKIEGDRTFWNSKLTSIGIPSTFNGRIDSLLSCSQLDSITVHPDNPNYKSVDGILYSKDGTVLEKIPAQKEFPDGHYSIPEGVKEIGFDAFLFNSINIKTLSIPSSLEHQESYKFEGFKNLYSITVHPDNPNYKSVDGILYSKDGTVLEKIPAQKEFPDGHYSIPEGVKELAFDAITFSSNIESLTFPKSFEEFSEISIEQCPNLKELNFLSIPVIYETSILSCEKLDLDKVLEKVYEDLVDRVDSQEKEQTTEISDIEIDESR